MAEAPPSWHVRPDIPVALAAPGIHSTLAPAERAADYDRLAFGYDLIVGNPVYNRLVWGCPPIAYATAAAMLLDRATPGDVLDFGCGSLIFTAHAYAGAADRLILFDRSLAMLRRAEKRLPAGRFLQGDALAPPFAGRAFGGAMAWGMIHLFGSASPFLDRLAACVAPGAPVATSSLVLAGRRTGDIMLRLLHRRGEAAEPEHRDTIEAAFARHFHLDQAQLCGNMLFLAGRARR